LIGCVRMTVRYRSRRIDDVRERPRVLAEERRRSGYRSLHVLLRFSRAFSLSSCFNRQASDKSGPAKLAIPVAEGRLAAPVLGRLRTELVLSQNTNDLSSAIRFRYIVRSSFKGQTAVQSAGGIVIEAYS
jgi:hypothetical protein